MYVFGYPKTKVLAQFVDSKAFFLYPWKKGLFKKSVDVLATVRQGSIALPNIFFANFSVKKGSKSDKDYSLFCLELHQKILFTGCRAVLKVGV